MNSFDAEEQLDFGVGLKSGSFHFGYYSVTLSSKGDIEWYEDSGFFNGDGLQMSPQT